MKNEGYEKEILAGRNNMKSGFGKNAGVSDQKKGLPQPPLCKGPTGGDAIALPKNFKGIVPRENYLDLLLNRRSQRVFENKQMTLEQLSFLLWSTQGILEEKGKTHTLRPVPSGGARHPFESYIAIQNVEKVKQGLYHYLPLEHKIEFIAEIEEYTNSLTCALAGQTWASLAPAVFFWCCEAYRGEWRYTVTSHRVMLLDAGHIGQNLMLSAQALGLGSCCIAAYDQQECDKLLHVDGVEEFIVYAAAVGKPMQKQTK